MQVKRAIDKMENKSESEASLGRLFLPSLTVSSFAVGPLSVWAALLLIDIGYSLNTSVGVTGQINTSYSIAAFIFALLMGVLSIRFKHKSLLLVGLALIGVSALGCFLASDYVMMLVFYSISGIGYAMANPMIFALVGEHLPLKNRANAIGWVVAGGALVFVIGAPVIAITAGIGGWRLPLLAFVMPILLVSLLLAFPSLPSTSINRQTIVDSKTYLRSFREILLNRSAVACLTGDFLRSAAFVALVIYVTSFVRQRFLLSTDLASIVLLFGALSYAIGSLACGFFVNRFGRKLSAVVTAFLAGIFIISYVYVPIFWLSLLLILVASWFSGMVASAANSLTLEQVPKLRGSMMSIDSAVLSLGSALGTAAGGLALLYFNYEGLCSVLGIIGMVAALILFALAKDPTKENT